MYNQCMKYFPLEIEKKWQKTWEEKGIYRATDFDKKKKFYALIEFPYPSGAGLHVGHVRSWSAMDAYSRKKRMEGFNVLYPIGWDAFGLPAENYAIKNKIHPSIAVAKNIATFKRQVKSLGLSFDWSREVNTTDSKYYKWTQWIFLKFFEKGLAFQADVPVNWCPFCRTNLADEEVMSDGTHERCGNKTQKRMQKQWLLKITAYADKLLEGLKLVDYSSKIAIQQVNWIGRKEGTLIRFKIKDSRLKNEKESKIEVFTTRADTLYGATFIVLAPEHPLVVSLLSPKFKTQSLNMDDIKKYVEQVKRESEIERAAKDKEKTGMFSGLCAVNPVNNEEIPVWIANYALMGYGTGALFGDAHDERDVAFAKKYNIPLKPTIKTNNEKLNKRIKNLEECFTGYGTLFDSGEFDGLTSQEAIRKVTVWLEKRKMGGKQTAYHLRDWVFSRQHYWGEPIPIIHCKTCGVVPVPEEDLPVELPYLEEYEPSGTGESPLAKVSNWVNVNCPKCGEKARRETDTMPNWAGSNWYFLRYLDPQNDKVMADKKKMEYWMPVDVYQGGFEHTTLHLLYSRFVYKFLYDIGAVPTKEPYAKRRSHGIVLGPDGRKMSKSFGNVINPDDIIGKFGADALRIYEMFMGPFDQTIAWSEESVEGCSRFLKRFWQLSTKKVSNEKTSRDLLTSLNKTIKKVDGDLDNMKFNTAVAAMMEFVNAWQADKGGLDKQDFKKFLLILAPFAPHITEEIWSKLEEKFSIHQQHWPIYDSKLLVENEIKIAVQVNGKIRGLVEIKSVDVKNQKEVEHFASLSANVKKHLEGKKIKKVIYVEGRIINFVLNS